jgi:hypothetical protein
LLKKFTIEASNRKATFLKELGLTDIHSAEAAGRLDVALMASGLETQSESLQVDEAEGDLANNEDIEALLDLDDLKKTRRVIAR